LLEQEIPAEFALLELAFLDLAALGHSGVLRDSPHQSFESFNVRDLADTVAAQVPAARRPLLQREIDSVLSSQGGDPLELLRACVSSGSLYRGAVRIALFTPSSGGPPQPSVGFDIADSHLHSGASIPLEVLLESLVSRRRGFSRHTIAQPLTSKTGAVWDVVVLLAAVRWAYRYIWFLYSGGSRTDQNALLRYGLDGDVAQWVSDGSYWTVVRDLALDLDGRRRGAFRKIAGTLPREGRVLNLGDVFWRFVDDYGSTSESSRSFAVSLARAALGLGASVTSTPSEGLSRFADRFETVGLVRDASVEAAKARLVEWSLQHWATSDVVGAEFRKTIPKSSVPEFRSGVRSAIHAHIRGFQLFMAGDGRARALSVPIGFSRMPHPSRCAGVGGWNEFQHVVLGSWAIADVAAPDVTAFLQATTSTDVAGDEFGSANWPFVVGAELLSRYGIDTRFTIHSGEMFNTPFNGVRRIGELFLGVRAPDRIGHALALSERAASLLCRGKAPALGRVDAIMDLCWAITSNLSRAPEVKDLLYKIVAPVHGRSAVAVDAWVDASLRLFTLDGLSRGGLLHLHGERFWPRNRLELLATVRSDDARALVGLATGTGSEVTGCDLTQPIEGQERDAFLALCDSIAAEARESVWGTIKAQADLVIESCPQSNVVLTGGLTHESHPLWEWLAEGVSVSISSDDPLVFGASITDEFMNLLSCDCDQALARKAAVTSVSSCSGGARHRLSDYKLLRQSPIARPRH
jgi:hypothetical protein